MKKKNKKNSRPIPVLTERAKAYQKHIRKGVMRSGWFWSSVVTSAAFMTVFLASTVEAGVRYQAFREAGDNFNKAWTAAASEKNPSKEQMMFTVQNPRTGHAMNYWFGSYVFNQKDSKYTGQYSAADKMYYIYNAAKTKIAELPISEQKEFHYVEKVNGKVVDDSVTYYKTNVYFTPFWKNPVDVSDNGTWDWLACPLFGQYPNIVHTLERGQEEPNADMYKCLANYYANDNPGQYVNLSFMASLFPKTMNMNYGYWIIAATFFSAFAVSFCVTCSYIAKLSKTFKSDKKDDENTLAKYLESEANSMGFEYEDGNEEQEFDPRLQGAIH